MNGELYKKGFSLQYLKCLTPEGICGNHSRPHSLVGKTIRAGYFCPTMQQDAVELVKKCDKCQQFGNVQHIPGELLTSISLPWPFSIWGINIVGPLPQGKKQVKFLLIAIDYFTKWVESQKAKYRASLGRTLSTGLESQGWLSLIMVDSLIIENLGNFV